MSYWRDSRYGIEYRPEEPSPETPWLLWAVGIAFVVALVYGSIAGYRAVVRWVSEKPSVEAPPVRPVVTEPVVPPPKLNVAGPRPRKVENLLMRLDRAVATTNVALQVATIEEIRALPGSPAADLDDQLARRLGELKLHMLFGAGMRNEWVKDIEIRRGNSASRIASEYGTTLKCIEKLNGDVSSIQTGKRLWVMNHPQFRLSVYRKTKIADLFLNGKFFKRYYLTGDVKGENGSYVFPVKTRSLLAEKSVKLADKDVSELEMLLPKGANMTIADFR